MNPKSIYSDGDNVSVRIFTKEDGATIALVPYACEPGRDGDSWHVFYTAAACSEFHAGSDEEEREITLGMYSFDSKSNKTSEYGLEVCRFINDLTDWRGFCAAVSIAMRGVLSLEKLVSFYIYVPSDLHPERVQWLLDIAAKRAEEEGYSLGSFDSYFGQILWYGERKTQDEVKP